MSTKKQSRHKKERLKRQALRTNIEKAQKMEGITEFHYKEPGADDDSPLEVAAEDLERFILDNGFDSETAQMFREGKGEIGGKRVVIKESIEVDNEKKIITISGNESSEQINRAISRALIKKDSDIPKIHPVFEVDKGNFPPVVPVKEKPETLQEKRKRLGHRLAYHRPDFGKSESIGAYSSVVKEFPKDAEPDIVVIDDIEAHRETEEARRQNIEKLKELLPEMKPTETNDLQTPVLDIMENWEPIDLEEIKKKLEGKNELFAREYLSGEIWDNQPKNQQTHTEIKDEPIKPNPEEFLKAVIDRHPDELYHGIPYYPGRFSPFGQLGRSYRQYGERAIKINPREIDVSIEDDELVFKTHCGERYRLDFLALHILQVKIKLAIKLRNGHVNNCGAVENYRREQLQREITE